MSAIRLSILSTSTAMLALPIASAAREGGQSGGLPFNFGETTDVALGPENGTSVHGKSSEYPLHSTPFDIPMAKQESVTFAWRATARARHGSVAGASAAQENLGVLDMLSGTAAKRPGEQREVLEIRAEKPRFATRYRAFRQSLAGE